MDERVVPSVAPGQVQAAGHFPTFHRYLLAARRYLAPPSPEVLATRLDTALMPDEEVLWCGRPRRLSNLGNLHAGAFLGMIFLAPTGAQLWVSQFTLKPHSYEVAWWGVFGSICAVIYAGMFARHIYNRDRTIFGLTKDSVIIRRGGADQTTKIDLLSIPHLTLEMETTDFGSIHFGNRSKDGKPAPLAFSHIRHARQVFELVRQTQRKVLGDAVAQSPLLNGPEPSMNDMPMPGQESTAR